MGRIIPAMNFALYSRVIWEHYRFYGESENSRGHVNIWQGKLENANKHNYSTTTFIVIYLAATNGKEIWCFGRNVFIKNAAIITYIKYLLRVGGVETRQIRKSTIRVFNQQRNKKHNHTHLG